MFEAALDIPLGLTIQFDLEGARLTASILAEARVLSFTRSTKDASNVVTATIVATHHRWMDHEMDFIVKIEEDLRVEYTLHELQFFTWFLRLAPSKIVWRLLHRGRDDVPSDVTLQLSGPSQTELLIIPLWIDRLYLGSEVRECLLQTSLGSVHSDQEQEPLIDLCIAYLPCSFSDAINQQKQKLSSDEPK